MRNLLISLVAVVFVGSLAQAQVPARYKITVPRTLSAGTIMTARTLASMNDTTQAIDIRGCTFVGLTFLASADSLGVIVKVQGSTDGTNYGALTTIDSVKHAVSTVTGVGAIAVPDKYMSFPFLRFNVSVSADGPFGAVPAPTVRTEVIRRFN
jgi:hypothetical protein